MKFEANIEAVILRQSVQWQMKVSTRSSPSTGYSMVSTMPSSLATRYVLWTTYELEDYRTAVAACGRLFRHRARVSML